MQEKLEAWSHGEKAPDLSVLNPDESQSIKAACSTPKIMSGPAAYDHCLQEQIKALTRPDASVDKDRRATSPPPSGDSESKRKGAPWLTWLLEAGGTALLFGLRERKRRCVGCQVMAYSAGELCISCLNKQNETSRAVREQAEREGWQRREQAETARQCREAEERSRGEKEALHREREERERRERLRTNTQAENVRSDKWEYGFRSSSDPFSILGVSRGASPVEIRNAYHREISKYHPDKVSHLGDELQQVAKRRAQTINQAYADIRKGD
jgi:DnaJ-domain-containing protein 1